MIRRFVFSLFVFAVLFSFGADPIYYFCESADDGGYGYAWVPSMDDVLANLPSGYWAFEVDPDEYYDNFSEGYIPFSSDPAYASPTPSNPPSGGGGGGGGSPSGGDGEGGFDPSSTLNSTSSVVGGLAVAVVGVITAAALICILFIYWRKTKTSLHLCEDRYGRISYERW